MYTIAPLESLTLNVRTAVLNEVEWITTRSLSTTTLYTPNESWTQGALDSLLLRLLDNYINGATQVTEEAVASELDPYAGKREVLYLPYKGILDRGITRGR